MITTKWEPNPDPLDPEDKARVRQMLADYRELCHMLEHCETYEDMADIEDHLDDLFEMGYEDNEEETDEESYEKKPGSFITELTDGNGDAI